MRSIFSKMAMIVTLLFVLSTFNSMTNFSNVEAAKQTIKLGVVSPFTGENAEFGSNLRDGANIAIDQLKAAGKLKNYDIDLVCEDDKGNPTAAVNSVNKFLYHDKVMAVIGHVNSTNTLATMGITKQNQTPQLAPCWSVKVTDSNNPYIFRVTASDSIAANTLVDYLIKTKMTKIAIINENDDFGRGGMENIKKAMKVRKLAPVAVESYTRGDKDFSGQLLKISAQKPQAVLIWGIYVETAAIAQQIRQLFSYDVQILGSSGMAPPPYRNIAGKAADGSIYVAAWSNADSSALGKKFIADYKGKYHKDPSDIAARGYDAMMIISKALDKMGNVSSQNVSQFRKKLRNAIAKVKFQGLQGAYAFDKTGEGLKKCVLVQIMNGKDVIVN
jgi:branched-chain amino acid transport system substrate-binding protein